MQLLIVNEVCVAVKLRVVELSDVSPHAAGRRERKDTEHQAAAHHASTRTVDPGLMC
jgi:hypothetical protein